MNQYNMTDNEQVQMLKQWWKDYGKIVAIAVVIGLVVAFSWRYWRHHKTEMTQKASSMYEQLIIADSKQQASVAEKIAAQLMQQYRRTPYAAMAALWWAEHLVNNKNEQSALQKTKWVITNSSVDTFKQIARLRMARILLNQMKPQAALETLKTINDKTYQPLIEALKGDIYSKMKQPKAAAKAYKTAQDDMKAAGINNFLLDMKIAQ